MTVPRDNEAHRFPVSVKGILLRADTGVTVQTRRAQWELPGGKLEVGVAPERCVAREIGEELGLEVEPVGPVDAWVYPVAEGIHVLIVTYGCVEREQRAAV